MCNIIFLGKSKVDLFVTILLEVSNNSIPKPNVHNTYNTYLRWSRANSNVPLFRKLAGSSHGQRNGRQFMEISYMAN
jgi:hypothetical protein